MAATGEIEIDFGAAPGKDLVTVAVARAAVTANTHVEAYLFPKATADHSADEHIIDGPVLFAHNVQAGVGFDVAAIYKGQGLCAGRWTGRWVSTD